MGGQGHPLCPGHQGCGPGGDLRRGRPSRRPGMSACFGVGSRGQALHSGSHQKALEVEKKQKFA